ncbi:MAG: 2-oxoacid:acceptor oxidoreductase family protein [Proteobacteria bacterium]|nr:2-oxoacid:acceptor oxidoreductase family protein [Pseudomonadota bacterium]MBU2228164.1 2-oxoacid:acceptor oxidoreductase family protein [Pseudomonadota bacterium]MBU2262485.1 2-oxoacid:acceptor oxidoreductase family protein [Pseudomonadota bacterium]
MRKEIIFTGFGGQGIILMGVIMARMMEHFPDLHVAQAQSYGPASRGGACRTDVVISDQQINYPKSSRPDLMVFMSEEALKRHLPEGDPTRTLIVYDNTMIGSIPPPFTKTFAVPATRVAEEELKNRIVANIFMLGAVIELMVPDSFDILKEVVRKSIPQKSEALNMKALEAGHDYYLANKP